MGADGVGKVDRRALIKRAAAAGALAWSAPVVVGSITSPAGAVTPPVVSCTCTNGRALRRTWAAIKADAGEYNDYDNKCAELGGSNQPNPTGSCVPACFTIPTTCTDPLGGSFAFNKPVPGGSTYSISLASNAAGCRIIDGRQACTVGIPSSVSTCTAGVLSDSDRTITFNKCPAGNEVFVFITWCCG